VSATIAQCKSCPWRVGCDPVRDIPGGYSVELHVGLAGTIATPGAICGGPMRAMACHYSEVGKEHVCAGWLHNQIGDGNNIPARLAVMRGRLPSPEVTGEQHATFDDTLPRAQAVSRARRIRP
jgi:hypothetical protein